jgi:hypothetical protein
MAEEDTSRNYPDMVEMPAPSFWPMILAFGVTLLLTGIVTHYVVTLVGFVLSVRAAIGWWRDVIPHELHEEVAVRHPADWAVPVRTTGRSVATLRVGAAHHRMRVPERIHPYKAGLWGGIAGGAAMAILACIYGQVAHGSIWYPVNLLAATVLPEISHASDAALNQFQLVAFGVAVLVHAITSILVGVLYTVTLPMFPRRAPLWAGFIIPLFWTCLIAATLTLTNPTLNEHINWTWFIICQIAFGLVAGFVTAKTQRIDTMQNLPFIERAAIESQWSEGQEGKGRQ